ncbi:TPA_asm: L protein [Raton olivaceo morbillivirus]|uniref:RNA-directed RNA polymerase L n=1 Tax=Raton olivaceo morbillivirus TaxID=2928189 RepID=A0A9N7ABD7_9MONO|nr:TPA_asm: L protein [Raton olivaceo morbillivirus]
MDSDTSATLSSIIYPEVHLDSPLVTSKLVYLLEYSNLIHNQILIDQTLVNNINYRKQQNLKSPSTLSLSKHGEYIRTILINYPNAIHVPYPECNSTLFYYRDTYLTQQLQDIHNEAKRSYNKCSPNLIQCLRHIDANNGGTSSISLESQDVLKDLPGWYEGGKWYEPFLFWFTVKTEMRKVNKTMTYANNKHFSTPHHINSPKSTLVFHPQYLMLLNKQMNIVYYLTFEMVLMLSDVVEGRLQTEFAMRSDIRYSGLISKVYLLWDTIDALFQDLGNATYSIVALLEPLALAHLQLRDPVPEMRGAFLRTCLSDLDQILIDNGFDNKDDIRALHRIVYDIFDPQDIHLTAEMFSFFRSFGHPTLEAINAATKVRKYMNLPKVIDYQTMMKAHAIFCGIIINGHRDRHGGTWPPCTLPPHAAEKIVHSKNNNEALTDALCVENWKSFTGFHFKCFMPLSLDKDLTMYLKDKALAALKSEWDSSYNPNTMRYRPKTSTTSRRLVNVFLEDSEFDPFNMIQYVLTGEYLKDEDFNLSYSLKEKEVKEVARLFAKMTYKMRACQVIAESLISNGIGDYFKDNGMAKSEHELTKSLHTLALSGVPRDKTDYLKTNRLSESIPKLGKYPKPVRNEDAKFKASHVSEHYETVSAFITADLMKYCLNWRHETTSIFAERLNEIYGLPDFFQWLHKVLEKSTLYVSDPYCPPDFDKFTDLDDAPNDHLYIKYPMGGIEGFCQKLWTISTIPYLYLAAYDTGVRISSLVQGDNQAIAVTKRIPSSYPFPLKKKIAIETTIEYFKRLREILGWVGHNLKSHETVISSNFFVYSKGIYYDGLLLSQSLKSLSRCVFWSETIVDETRSACSNISTTIAKGIEKGFDRYLAYAFNFYKTILQLLVSLKFTINPTMTHDVVLPITSNNSILLMVALIPAPIGGFNYLNMSRLFTRNIGDVVTASFADIKRMILSGLLPQTIIQKIMTQSRGVSTFLDWASDPYSANLPSSQSITKLIKNITARYVLSHSPNPMLHDLFHESSDAEDNDLAQFLLDRDIIIPRAAHEILDNTVTGARESIAGMLDTTKGLIRVGLKRGGLRPNLVQRITMYDYQQFRNVISLIGNNRSNDLINWESCSVDLARALRNHMWADLAKGRKIYGLEVPDTLECLTGAFITGHSQCQLCVQGSDHYGWFFVPANCELDQVTRSTSSMRVPYVGSTTDERSDMTLAHVKSPSQPLRAAVRIATVYTWAYGDDDQSWFEAWSLASQRANITYEDLKLITPISTSTNLAHRLRDKSTQVKYSGTSLIRVSRYVSISNDQLSFTLDGKRVDTNFIYQQCMLLGLAILEQYYRLHTNTGPLNTILHLHADTNCCITKMEDQPYVPSRYPVPRPIVHITNRLIYDDNPVIEKDLERINYQGHLKPLLEFTTWETKTLYHMLSKSTACTIIEIITKTEKDHLNEIKAVIANDDINSMISEFLLVDPKLFCIYLGQYISVNWSYDIHYHRPRGKVEMCELLYGMLIRTPFQSFNILMNALSHEKIYQRFWNVGMVEPIHGPSLDTQNLFLTIVELMVRSYRIYLDLWLDEEMDDYSLLMCETDMSIIDMRIDNLQAKNLCMICDLYCDPSGVPHIRGIDPLQKCKLLINYIMGEKMINPGGASWNVSPLVIDHYPCSLTYIRRGTIKQIRLRVDPGFVECSLTNAMVEVPPVIKRLSVSWNDVNAMTFSQDLGEMLTEIRTQGKTIPLVIQNEISYDIHSYRRVGINSSACYKALELIPYIKGYIDLTLDRLYLAEGAGSMLVTYQHHLGHGNCYYNSGVSLDSLKGQRELKPYPAEVALAQKTNSSEWKSNMKVLFNGRPEVTWIGNIECYQFILNEINPSSLGFIHCDLESSKDKNSIEILEELVHVFCLSLVLGSPGSCLVLKLMPRPDDFIFPFLRFTSEYYNNAIMVIPAYSNMSSSEIYVVYRGLKVNKLLNPNLIVARLPSLGNYNTQLLFNMILDIKFRNNVVSKIGTSYIDGQPNTFLSKITEHEKLLLEAGLSLNGEKCLKKWGNFELLYSRDELESSLRGLIKEIASTLDPSRTVESFLSPYPVLMESKVREMIHHVIRKMFILDVIYIRDPMRIIQLSNQLRRHILTLDIQSSRVNRIVPAYIYRVLINSGYTSIWSYHLSVAEVKEGFKILGYSILN